MSVINIENLNRDVKSCNTLNEMWDTLDQYYNLDKELGFIAKNLVATALVKNIQKIVVITGTKPR